MDLQCQQHEEIRVRMHENREFTDDGLFFSGALLMPGDQLLNGPDQFGGYGHQGLLRDFWRRFNFVSQLLIA